MKKFNKNTAMRIIENKNNKKIKKYSIIISVVVLVLTIIYFSFARFEANIVLNLINGVVSTKQTSIITKMITLASNGATDLQYDGISTLGEYGTVDNNLRYVGINSNNYIYFNCSTQDESQMNDTTCEKWRIIGLFNNIEDENGVSSSKVKIMRNNSLGQYTWDYSDSSLNQSQGINQWGPSGNYEGSDLMLELNNDYLGNITQGIDGKWYGYNFDDDGIRTDKPTTILNTNSQSMIETVKWYTGTSSTSLASEGESATGFSLYVNERNNSATNFCTGTRCNDTVERTPYWIGKIGLIYASDGAYSIFNGSIEDKKECLGTVVETWIDCGSYSWLSQGDTTSLWTMSSVATSSDASYVYALLTGGYYADGDPASNSWDVHPTLYLKENVKVLSGDGSSSNPYKIKI